MKGVYLAEQAGYRSPARCFADERARVTVLSFSADADALMTGWGFWTAFNCNLEN
jgi:hypothetical protein